MAKATRHIPYVPRPGYELLQATGLRRYPQCVRPNVQLMVPLAFLRWLPLLGHLKFRVLLPDFTVN